MPIDRRTRGFVICLLACLAAAPAGAAETPRLPETVPVPPGEPTAATDERADAPSNDDEEPQQAPANGAEAPRPAERPDPPAAASTPEPPAPVEADPEPPDPRSAQRRGTAMPDEEVQCRDRLRAARVEFAEADAQHDELGCSMPWPVELRSIPGGIAVTPAAVMNCDMAEATARFLGDTAQPLARQFFKSGIKAVGQASAYVCRPRNGTSKLSEHAFGNAFDIAQFELADSRQIVVGASKPAEGRAFVETLRRRACGTFKTVLGPGSDADHEDHLHLDLAERSNGGTFCQ
jgi:hypothetical protein